MYTGGGVWGEGKACPIQAPARIKPMLITPPPFTRRHFHLLFQLSPHRGLPNARGHFISPCALYMQNPAKLLCSGRPRACAHAPCRGITLFRRVHSYWGLSKRLASSLAINRGTTNREAVSKVPSQRRCGRCSTRGRASRTSIDPATLRILSLVENFSRFAVLGMFYPLSLTRGQFHLFTGKFKAGPVCVPVLLADSLTCTNRRPAIVFNLPGQPARHATWRWLTICKCSLTGLSTDKITWMFS